MNMTAHVAALAAILPLSLVLVPDSSPAADIVGRIAVHGAGIADAVVSVEGPVVATPGSAPEVAIDHRDLRFTPHVIVVPVGAHVRFDNSDGMPCRIYCVSRIGSFVRRDQAAIKMTLDRPGIIEVRCADHPKLSAFIVVTANPYAAITDENGAYAIRDVPAGKYRVQVWSDGAVLATRSLVVGSTTATMNIGR